MFVKDSDCEPGGHRDYKCGPVFPPGACRQEFNGGVNVSTCRKGGGKGGSSGTGNTLPTFFMSNTSLCVTCHLRDTLTSSPLPASHTQTPFQKCKQAPSAFVACLWVRKVAGPSLSPYGSFWSHAQFDFPSASLIKASWTFLWRWERREGGDGGGGEKREGKRS